MHLAEKYKKNFERGNRAWRRELLFCISLHGEVPSLEEVKDTRIARILAACYRTADARPTAQALCSEFEGFLSELVLSAGAEGRVEPRTIYSL